MFPRPAPLSFLDLTRPDPREDLALDEALLRSVDQTGGPGLLRVWERPEPCVVLGRANRLALNADRTACEAADVPILRRASGGGTVLLGPGALCWSLILPVGPPAGLPGDIPAVTAAIMHRLADALRPLVPGVGVDGTSDLTVRGVDGARVKVGGNAQRWLKRAMLHHGTLLTGFDLAAIPRFLTPPERQPDYRAGRAHRAFVTNLPLPRAALVSALRTAFGATAPPPELPTELMGELFRDRYSDPAWHLRR
ncbi:lipoate--protein ligase family protein [Alienimonas californiensis]|uniref:Lipoate-protein ligase A n=1 Tax=Alienimonas californiensis TaxID=2527989 RepID=A0A517P905_9PLAN|nr:lipoate--protein ligase family protein [Alienimonas californiensis]QDT15847.1 Lipoate-protein ligase A [Alienimonas californiensis]